MMRRTLTGCLTAAVALGLGMGAPALSGVYLGVAGAQTAPAAAEPKVGDTVVITLANGTTIEGVITAMDSRQVKVQRTMAGGIKADVGYQRSEIRSMTVKAGGGAAPAGAPVSTPSGTPTATPSAPSGTTAPAATPASDPSAKTVYVLPLSGQFGRDVSATPLRQAMRDIKRSQPDILVIRVDFNFAINVMGDNVEFLPDPDAVWQLETARQLSTILTDEIRDDKTWTKKPRLVMWVRRALGAAAFLPFVAPDIYFTNDGLQGGIGNLELVAAGGDEVYREKIYGIMLARAEGLAIKGGHEPKLVQAMARTRYSLSFSMVNGVPQFFEDTTGDTILTDDGDQEAGRRDTLPQVVRFEGNDWLTLKAPVAQQIGFSRGTVDRLEDLMAELGVARNYTVLRSRAGAVFQNWSRSVGEAEADFNRTWREFNEIEVQGQSAAERNVQRGRQLGTLRKMQEILKDYAESMEPQAIGGSADQWNSRLEVIMEQIRQQMRVDR
jgi:hypothetical protein